MDIKYLGHSSFFLRTKEAKIVLDPFNPKMVGLKFPRTEADIVTISHAHEDHSYMAGVSGSPLVIDMPGEFEKNGVRVSGFSTYHDKKKGEERGENVMYRIDADAVSVLHCGDMGFVPDEEYIEQLGEIDILMVPVGGFYTIDADEAVQFVKKVEPSMVVPMHYGVEGLNPELKEKLSPVSEFLKNMGAEGIEAVSKLTVKRDELLGGMKVVLMSASS